MSHTTDAAGFTMEWETSDTGDPATITLSLPRELHIDDGLDLFILQRRNGRWYASSDTVRKFFGLPIEGLNPYEPVGPNSAVMGDFGAETTTKRAAILDEAKKLTTGSRNTQYGEPIDDFTRIADALSALGYRAPGGDFLQPHDVSVIQSVVKLSRITNSPGKEDSWVDLAGYAAVGGEVAEIEVGRAR